jgi:hypothetical protein
MNIVIGVVPIAPTMANEAEPRCIVCGNRGCQLMLRVNPANNCSILVGLAPPAPEAVVEQVARGSHSVLVGLAPPAPADKTAVAKLGLHEKCYHEHQGFLAGDGADSETITELLRMRHDLAGKAALARHARKLLGDVVRVLDEMLSTKRGG